MNNKGPDWQGKTVHAYLAFHDYISEHPAGSVYAGSVVILQTEDSPMQKGQLFNLSCPVFIECCI